VGDAGRVGDIGASGDVVGVDLDATQLRVEAFRCAAAGAGSDHDVQVIAPVKVRTCLVQL
jgi:hypothetical protein